MSILDDINEHIPDSVRWGFIQGFFTVLGAGCALFVIAQIWPYL